MSSVHVVLEEVSHPLTSAATSHARQLTFSPSKSIVENKKWWSFPSLTQKWENPWRYYFYPAYMNHKIRSILFSTCATHLCVDQHTYRMNIMHFFSFLISKGYFYVPILATDCSNIFTIHHVWLSSKILCKIYEYEMQYSKRRSFQVKVLIYCASNVCKYIYRGNKCRTRHEKGGRFENALTLHFTALTNEAVPKSTGLFKAHSPEKETWAG